VFGMGTGGALTLRSPKGRVHSPFEGEALNTDGRLHEKEEKLKRLRCGANKFYGQAERAISNGKLNALLRLHIRPIDVVVFHGPS
jgi:hypothetical protein